MPLESGKENTAPELAGGEHGLQVLTMVLGGDGAWQVLQGWLMRFSIMLGARPLICSPG